MRLSGALDNEILVAVQRFLSNGVPAEIDSLYTAIQRSNSSLKRRPKKVLYSSLERVLEFLNIESGETADSDAEIERATEAEDRTFDIMNRSLRQNLAAPAPPSAQTQSQRDENELDTSETRVRKRLANGEPLPKRQKSEKAKIIAQSEASLMDIGGVDDIIEQLEELLVLPLLEPETYRDDNIPVPRGVLLHGPPGCGKTMISRAFAAEMGVPCVEILGPAIVSGMSGESERGIRERFEEAKKHAPCLIFIDEIDAIAPKRESSQSQMEKRIVAQLLVSMDDLQRDDEKPVIVLAATNRPDSLDPALRRGGRFDTEINIGVPNEKTRERILRAQVRNTRISPEVDFAKLAKMTAGFVGADLHDLVSKAGSCQKRRYREALKLQAQELEAVGEIVINSAGTSDKIAALRRLISRAKRRDLPKPSGFETSSITMSDFLVVLPSITPSSKREGFATVPDVSWDDIGALQSVRKELQIAIVEAIQEPELYASLGISASTGVLLWGPPGCGKTLIAKAVAAESKANFISIKGPELLNKFVGESEAAVRRVFTRARSSVPCVIFFDELDALVPRRDDSGSESSARVVNTLLTELDGLSERNGIYVIGATNRPDMIDDAMLRPGRLETRLFVDLPGPSERVDILRTLLKNKPVDDVAEICELARTDRCAGFSGADLSALQREAGHSAKQRRGTRVSLLDFEHACDKVKASVNNMSRYYQLRDKFAGRF